jgi:hypothetical protein
MDPSPMTPDLQSSLSPIDVLAIGSSFTTVERHSGSSFKDKVTEYVWPLLFFV